MKNSKEILSKMIDSIIDGNDEQARVHFHEAAKDAMQQNVARQQNNAGVKRPPGYVDYHDIDWETAELDGIETHDAPDFSNAYLNYCEKKDGTQCTDAELDYISDHYGDAIHELVWDHFQ